MRPRAKPSKPYRWQYDFIVPLALYLDDIRDVFTVIGQIGAIKAETDTHTEISSFTDIAQLEGQPLTALKVIGTAPDGNTITADFGRGGASITVTSPRPEFPGALHQIQSIAWRHWRRFSLADNIWTISFLGFAGVGGTVGLSWWIAGVVAVVAVILSAVGFRERRNAWTVLPMVWYANRPPSFIKRNSDQIILGSIFLVLGAVLGTAGSFWLMSVR